MAKAYAVYLCGALEPLREQPCGAGGEPHTPYPSGYDAGSQYAAQLLASGWTQHRCPSCDLWFIWRPDQPNVQPPPRLNPDDEAGVWDFEIDDSDACPDCEDGWTEHPGIPLVAGVRTVQPLARYL